ncbi:MAG TPA: anti-sigma F factor antagonist [Syntrophomonadaceae bacterium]|nr:anti-sigma F factor antagonist [Syntrophomonadaceae bacterium]
MDLELKLVRNTLVVRIKGELDMLVTDKLRREIDHKLDTKEIDTLIMNLDKVTFIDSSGLGVIIGRYKKINANNGHMYIVGARPSVEKILFFSGINKLIPMFNSEQDIINL